MSVFRLLYFNYLELLSAKICYLPPKPSYRAFFPQLSLTRRYFRSPPPFYFTPLFLETWFFGYVGSLPLQKSCLSSNALRRISLPVTSHPPDRPFLPLWKSHPPKFPRFWNIEEEKTLTPVLISPQRHHGVAFRLYSLLSALLPLIRWNPF